MLLSDLVIAIIFLVISTIVLFKNENKIAAWQKEIISKNKNKKHQAAGANCGGIVKPQESRN